MEGDVTLRMLAPQLRDLLGRFRRTDPASALDKMLLEWGELAVAELREATPVEEGEPLQRGHPAPGTARASWRFDHLPTQKMIKVTNTAPHTKFLVTGTGQDTGGYIYPNVAPMLVFYAKEGPSAGRLIGRRRVRGIKPVPALVAAIERLGPVLDVMTHDMGTEIIKQVGAIG